MASVNDLLNLPFTALDEKTLRAALQQINDAANKRVRRGLQQKTDSPAIAQWKRQGGGFFTTKGKTRNQMLSEFKRVKAFMQDKTSTKKGQIAYQDYVRKRIEDQTGVKLTQEQAEQFFDVLEKVKEVIPMSAGAAAGFSSAQAYDYVLKRQQEGWDASQIISGLDQKITEAKIAQEFSSDWGL